MRYLYTFLLLLIAAKAQSAQDRPNVLWLTFEDTSPEFIGAYGNPDAKTPNIDSLAARGIRFENAYATAPVCAAARSSLLFGVDCFSLGTSPMRSGWPIPDFVKGFPTYLRGKGYYTTNNDKTDYNTSDGKRVVRESWDESSQKAVWENRKGEQPFFAVFNFMESHQSRIMTFPYERYQKEIYDRLKPEERIAEDAFEVPPFFPDTPEYRKQLARTYNGISAADKRIGEILKRLEDQGLADDTIIFCYADHGEGIPRGKINPIRLGYRVPFIVVIPEKWSHLNPWGDPGTVSTELINFTDLAPTMLSIVGAKRPKHFVGRALMGPERQEAPQYLFTGADRMGEAAMTSRSISDGRYVYTRHFMPDKELKYHSYWDQGEIVQLLRQDYLDGKLTPVQAGMMMPQAHEVLYDTQNDPWELDNLADDQDQAERAATMRKELFRHIVSSKDSNLYPEYEFNQLAQKKSNAYESAQSRSTEYFEELLHLADIASSPNTKSEIIAKVKAGYDDPRAYWIAVGLRMNSGYDLRDIAIEDFVYPPAQVELAAGKYERDGDAASFEFLQTSALSNDPTLSLIALQRIQAFGLGRAAAFRETLEQVKAREGRRYNLPRDCAAVTIAQLDKVPYEPGN